MTVVDKTYDTGVKPVIQAYDRLDMDPLFNEPKPPVSPRPSGLPKTDGAPVAVPTNGTPPYTSAAGAKVDLPGKAEYDAAGAEPPSYNDATKSEKTNSSSNTSTSSTPPSSTPKAKRPWYNRFILAGEVVLSSIEASTHDLISTGTAAASSAAGYVYSIRVSRWAAKLISVINSDQRLVKRLRYWVDLSETSPWCTSTYGV
jgi:spartin